MAWFTFTDASKEVFVVRLTDPDLVAHARGLLAGNEDIARIGGTIGKSPVGYNIGWSYHLDPASVFFFDMSTEVGDSTMRYIEDHLPEVGSHLLPGRVWTGWSTTLTDELRAMSGAAGSDKLVGTKGADLLFGREGDDLLESRAGADHLVAGAGADQLIAGNGNDKLAGGAGDDRLRGGWGRDVLVGGADNDRLNGGRGSDRLEGGAGHDTFVLRAGSGADRVLDFVDGPGADDRIDLRAFGLTSLDQIEKVARGDDLLLIVGEDGLRLVGYLRDHSIGDFGAPDVLL
jgi:Ca2+-binding RTX toxin-like protein